MFCHCKFTVDTIVSHETGPEKGDMRPMKPLEWEGPTDLFKYLVDINTGQVREEKRGGIPEC